VQQRALQRFNVLILTVLLGLASRTTDRGARKQDDRGDVPGWVMITMMTAFVVIALMTIFKTQVTEAVKTAFSSVTGAGNPR